MQEAGQHVECGVAVDALYLERSADERRRWASTPQVDPVAHPSTLDIDAVDQDGALVVEDSVCSLVEQDEDVAAFECGGPWPFGGGEDGRAAEDVNEFRRALAGRHDPPGRAGF